MTGVSDNMEEIKLKHKTPDGKEITAMCNSYWDSGEEPYRYLFYDLATKDECLRIKSFTPTEPKFIMGHDTWEDYVEHYQKDFHKWVEELNNNPNFDWHKLCEEYL
jgi:hypothetical protein